MSICRKCGEEILFRYIDGVLRPLHAYGTPCGERSPYSDQSLKRSDHTRCPQCQKMVFLVHHNGGRVWLDELGWPWPKHSCFDSGASRSPANSSSVPDWRRATQPTEAYDRTARAIRRCEFCDASVKLIRYAHHLATCKSAKRTIPVTDAQFRPRHPCRKCEFCNSMVRLDHYSAHVTKVHKTGNPVAATEIASAPIGQSVTAQSQVAVDNQNTGQRATSLSAAILPTSDEPVLTRCEFCKAKVKPSRLENHLRKAHSKFSDTHARRLCGKCHSIVDANLYDEHLRDKHGTTPHPAPSSKTPVAPDRDTPKSQSPGTTVEASPYPPGWFIDGRKRISTGGPPRQGTAKGITQSARAHPTPPSKPPIKPPKNKKKKHGAKKKGKKTQQSKTRFRRRLLQGGLRSPR